MIYYKELIKNKDFYKELTNIIKEKYNIECNCSDCGGSNQISMCKLEEYLKINLLDKNVEVIYNILDIKQKKKLEYLIKYCKDKLDRKKNSNVSSNVSLSSLSSLFCQCMVIICHNGIEINKEKKE